MERPMLFRLESGKCIVVADIVGIDGQIVLLQGGHSVKANDEDIDQILDMFQLIGNLRPGDDDGTWKPEIGV